MKFFNNPVNFSFKDALACAFSAPFLATIAMYMLNHNPADLELIKVLIPIEIVVLGGYFGQEVATSYFTRGQMISPYGNFGMNYNTGQAANVTADTGLQGPP